MAHVSDVLPTHRWQCLVHAFRRHIGVEDCLRFYLTLHVHDLCNASRRVTGLGNGRIIQIGVCATHSLPNHCSGMCSGDTVSQVIVVYL
jgi:hypothetical protein